MPSQPWGWNDGTFSVSHDGAAQYALPLWMPPGRGQVHPPLALSYDSRGGNGPLGVGWSLRGLSTITPCPRTVAQDGVGDAVGFDGTDVYCLDGNRLRPVGPVTGGQREYRTERDIFARVVAYGAAGAVPGYFRVWAKDGKILTFGQRTEDIAAQLQAYQLRAGPDPASPGLVPGSASRVTAAWAVNRIEDRNGNAATIDYRHAENEGDLWSAEMLPEAVHYDPDRSVRFSYEPRPDPVDGFGGGVHTRTAGRINRIAMFGRAADGQSELLREFRLSYQSTSITKRSLLSSVSECDHDGTCLKPLEFQWSQGSYDFDVIDTTSTDAGTSDNSGRRIITGDINADGKDDLLYPDAQNNWLVRRSNAAGSGFSAPVAAGIPRVHPDYQADVRPIDVDRDGRLDVMAAVTPPNCLCDPEYYLFRSNGTSFVRYTPAVDDHETSFLSGDPPYFLDLDGNGLPDYATPRSRTFSTGQWQYRLNTGAAGADRFRPMVSTTYDRGVPFRVRTLDSDGDGRAELLSLKGSSPADYRYESFGLNTAGQVVIKQPINIARPTPTSADTMDLHFADVNGDGLTDAVYPLSGLTTQLNSGNGFGPLRPGPAQYSNPAGPWQGPPDRGVRIVDFNGDGRDDVLVFHDGTPTGPGDYQRGLQLYVWQDGGFVRVPVNRALDRVPEPGSFESWHAAQPLDIDGDGMLDLVHVEDGAPDHLRVLKRRGGPPDQLLGVGVGAVGPRVQIAYTGLADAAVPGQCSYPQNCPVSGGSVVLRHQVANGDPGGWNVFTHSYREPRVDLSGRGWLGFAEHTVLDWRAGVTTVTEFDNITRDDAGGSTVYPYAQLPERTTVTVPLDAGGEYRHTVTNVHALRRLPVAGTYTVELRSVTETESERPAADAPWRSLRVRTTQTTYDLFGNPSVTDSGAVFGRRVTTRTWYQNEQASWLIGRPVRQQTTGCLAADQTCIDREVTYGYDGRGNLAQTVAEPQTPALRLSTVVERTSVGNISAITRSDAAGQSRTDRLGYDSDGLHVTAVTNPLGHASRATVHSGLGVPLSRTDPNGVTTTMRYDGFGRRRETNNADGSFEHIEHQFLFGAHAVFTRDAGGGFDISVLDPLGREKSSGVTPFGGGTQAFTDTTYDPLGRVSAVSRPTVPGQPVHSTTYAYDRRGRLVSQREPDGATVRHQYQGLEQHTYDAKGIHSYQVETVDGDIAARFEDDPRSTEWLQTRFEYGPFGELTTTAAPDGTSQMIAYDRLGRRTRHTDPSTGVTVATFNAFGEMVTETDGSGRVTRLDYDRLGRPVRLTSPDGVATNTWDTAANGIGKLAAARSADGIVTSHDYDALGRDAATAWNIEGARYEVGRGYDSVGRLSSLTYPQIPGAADRLRVSYGYNPAGYLTQARDAATGTVYWQADARNAAGQLERERFGNGVVSTREYQPSTGLLRNIVTTGPGAAGTLGSLSYGYDLNRNVTGRTDAVHKRSELYHHDTLNRLDRWHTLATGPGQVIIQATYGYHQLGGLTDETFQTQGQPKQNVVYRHGEGGAPPHALTSRNSAAYSYDGAGRQVTGPGRTVQYNGAGLPTVLTWGQGQRTEFSYDAAGARVLKRDAAQTTVSVPGLFERRTSHPGGDPPPDFVEVRNVHHILAGGRTVAQVARVQARAGGPVTATEISYLHADLQGSTVQVTGGSGQLKEDLFYDPFGRRIDAAYQPLPDNRRGGPRLGYTGHEHDDELGLINMKGRVYDPELRRFLTPDPIVQDRLSSQSHNRYSYVWNNPTTRTDPTGFQSLTTGSTFDPGLRTVGWMLEAGRVVAQTSWLWNALAAPSSDDDNAADSARTQPGETIVIQGDPAALIRESVNRLDQASDSLGGAAAFSAYGRLTSPVDRMRPLPRWLLPPGLLNRLTWTEHLADNPLVRHGGGLLDIVSLGFSLAAAVENLSVQTGADLTADVFGVAARAPFLAPAAPVLAAAAAGYGGTQLLDWGTERITYALGVRGGEHGKGIGLTEGLVHVAYAAIQPIDLRQVRLRMEDERRGRAATAQREWQRARPHITPLEAGEYTGPFTYPDPKGTRR